MTRARNTLRVLAAMAAASFLLGWDLPGPPLPARPAAERGDAMFEVTSPELRSGQPVPNRFTGVGEDVSPPLRWAGAPAGTKAFAILMEDPDAPRPPWVHWVLYNLPGSATSLREGIPRDAKLTDPAGALQGMNSWKTLGYRGPNPPPGKVHHYVFRVYALDAPLPAQSGLDREGLLKAMTGHILGHGDLVGTYQKQ